MSDNFSLPLNAVFKKLGLQSSRVLEIYLWVFLCIVVSGRVWLVNYQYGTEVLMKEFTSFYFDVLAGIALGIFPIVYFLIFSKLPIESLREKRKNDKYIKHIKTIEEIEALSEGDNVSEAYETDFEKIIKNIDSKLLMEQHSEASKSLSEKIYNRSGVYLLIGVLIAFMGMIFFYTQTIFLKEVVNINTLLFLMLPKSGVLIFIELIAFFFLKQYRASMEEFRYYEEIKRIREDNLAIVLLANELKADKVDFKTLVEKCNFGKRVGILSKGETTEHVESKKLEKDELEILDKIIGIINKSKK